MLVIAAGFVLAFGARNRLLVILAPMTLGVRSAMVLDEVVYLIATQATDDDYVSGASLGGSIVLSQSRSRHCSCFIVSTETRRDRRGSDPL